MRSILPGDSGKKCHLGCFFPEVGLYCVGTTSGGTTMDLQIGTSIHGFTVTAIRPAKLNKRLAPKRRRTISALARANKNFDLIYKCFRFHHFISVYYTKNYRSDEKRCTLNLVLQSCALPLRQVSFRPLQPMT